MFLYSNTLRQTKAYLAFKPVTNIFFQRKKITIKGRTSKSSTLALLLTHNLLQKNQESTIWEQMPNGTIGKKQQFKQKQQFEA